ncbi:MAG: Gfo/Idh/MocA family oxidoreductase [Kiritimatiellae bacterium]|nr:Gfo/Idh/MocA family oxidoreductase [Kiritimatiellia bacterium]
MKVKYVLVGFGGIAENRVAKEGYACDVKRFKALKTAQLVGATDLNPARQAAAEALGLKWYPSLGAVLADKAVDGVYIATNNASHAKLACEALKAGKHVIVEKPIATSVADAKAMSRIAKAKKLSLTVDHMMVNNAWNVAGKAAIAAGKLGKVNDSCFHMEFAYGYDPAEAATWRCSKVAEMGGPIGDVASHCFYVAEFMFGKKIKKVAAVYYPKVMKIKAEDGAYIKFFFEDGTQGSVNAAFSEMRGGLAGTLTNLGYEIYGDKAAMRGYGTMFQLSGYADEPIVQRLEIDDGKKVSAVKPAKIQNIYQTLIEGHAKSVLGKKPLTADDAIHNLALCAACHESAKKGGKVVTVRD